MKLERGDVRRRARTAWKSWSAAKSLDEESSLFAALWCAAKSLDAESSLIVASLVVAVSLDVESELERDDDDCLLEAEVERKVG